MTEMVVDHKDDVAAFQRESNWARDSQVKSFATETLPTLREHLKNAQEMSWKTSANPSAKTSAKKTSALGQASVQTPSGKPSPSKVASSKPTGGRPDSLR